MSPEKQRNHALNSPHCRYCWLMLTLEEFLHNKITYKELRARIKRYTIPGTCEEKPA